ncbi:MAG: hypothetical protein IIW86_02115 [Clostridia bacterium]|nr:hypothetical protein [Clostridia bacterium]
MIGEVTHRGGSYTSSDGKTESWEYDPQTGLKTYTSGPRAGQTERISAGASTMATSTVATAGASEDNTLKYILIALAGASALYLLFGKKRKSKKRR